MLRSFLHTWTTVPAPCAGRGLLGAAGLSSLGAVESPLVSPPPSLRAAGEAEGQRAACGSFAHRGLTFLAGPSAGTSWEHRGCCCICGVKTGHEISELERPSELCGSGPVDAVTWPLTSRACRLEWPARLGEDAPHRSPVVTMV